MEYLVGSAAGLTVVRAVGVESDMELPFAALHQLCAPFLDRVDGLPAPQRQALRIVFGLSERPAPDWFLVGFAVLNVLSDAGEERPLLCVVDDAQWLDHASALTLAFVARRLLVELVGLVFATREPSEELQHLSELEVHGLTNGDARALLLRACQQLGIGVATVDAETDGLLEISERVTFRHPLVRSAVHRSAPVQERRKVHSALAAATDRGADPDRRAWHLAAAAPEPYDEVAVELERSAASRRDISRCSHIGSAGSQRENARPPHRQETHMTYYEDPR